MTSDTPAKGSKENTSSIDNCIDDNRINKDTVLKFLALSRLDPKIEPLEVMAEELNSILGYIESLFKIDVKDEAPLTHMNVTESVFREDVCEPHVSIREFLQNAPDSSGTFFRVPLVIE